MNVLDRVAVLEKQREEDGKAAAVQAEEVRLRTEERWEIVCRRLDDLESTIGIGKTPGTGVHTLSLALDASPLRQCLPDYDLSRRLDRIEDLLRGRGVDSNQGRDDLNVKAAPADQDHVHLGHSPSGRTYGVTPDPVVPKRGAGGRFATRKKATR